MLKNAKDEIDAALQRLRLNGVVNPIKDDQQKWALTNEGSDLRNILLSLSIWGRHQIDDQEEQTPELIVEPERVADLKELVRFRDGVVRKYLDI